MALETNVQRIDWLGVIVGAAAGFAISMLWYSQMLFGVYDMVLRGLDPGKDPGGIQVGRIIAELARCFLIAVTYGYFTARLRISSVTGALYLATAVAIGFQLTGQVSAPLHKDYPLAVTAIQASLNLIQGIVAATIVMWFQRRLSKAPRTELSTG
ncbi:DUF1761 domain-containing protein [Mesorhizobium amorphae]